MKFELFRDGKLYMTIETIGGETDLTILPKSVIKNSALSPQSFEDLFFKCMNEAETNVEAYEKAEQIHEQFFDTRRYSSYDSFRTQKNKK
ncbi:MAG TPA: hypothetical protein VFD46_01940 [Chryseolinea sp.]|nr:hypothetical protein [Chryseolinea sp.]